MEYHFHEDDEHPVDEGDGAVGFKFSLAIVGVDDIAGAAHEVDDADEVHDGGILHDVDGFADEVRKGYRKCLRRYDAEDSVKGRKAEYDGNFALPLVYGKVGRTDDFRNNR